MGKGYPNDWRHQEEREEPFCYIGGSSLKELAGGRGQPSVAISEEDREDTDQIVPFVGEIREQGVGLTKRYEEREALAPTVVDLGK